MAGGRLGLAAMGRPKLYPEGQRCAVDGCENQATRRDMCTNCYMAERRGLKPLITQSVSLPELGIDDAGAWRATPGQVAAAPWLCDGLSVARVAQETGIERRTIEKWCAIPAYRTYITEMRKERLKHLEPALGNLMDLAAAQLARTLDPGYVPDEHSKYRDGLADRILRASAWRLLQARARAEQQPNSGYIDAGGSL